MATLVTNRVIQDGTINYEDLAPAALRILNPPGAVMSFAMSAAPDGWLPCNGAAINKTTYAPLFSAIGGTFGSTLSTFNVPDLRGEFIRGWAWDRAVDTGRVFGSSQVDGIKDHQHRVGYRAAQSGTGFAINTLASEGPYNYNVSMVDGTSQNETRPRNIALLYCIKF